MRIEKPGPNEPTFKWKLNKKEAKLLISLPKEEIAKFDELMLNAPIDSSKKSSNIRDSIIKQALKLAKKLKKVKKENK